MVPGPPRGIAPPAPEGQEASTFRPGQRVEAVNLSARPDLNGKKAKLLEYVDQEERWKVWFEDGFGKSLREVNLRPCNSSDHVEASPSSASPPHVATPPTVPQSQAPGGLAASRRCVRSVTQDSCRGDADQDMHPQRQVASGPHEVLKAGIWAQCIGLTANVESNGQLCRLLNLDSSSGRWRVVMQDGIGRTILPEHLTPVPDPLAGQDMFPTSHPDRRQHVQTSKPLHSESPEDKVDARQQMTGLQVTIASLPERPDLNGRDAKLVKYDESTAQWEVEFKEGLRCKVKGANLVTCEQLQDETVDQSSMPENEPALTLSPNPAQADAAGVGLCVGAEVTVTGLRNRKDINGKRGELLWFDECICW